MKSSKTVPPNAFPSAFLAVACMTNLSLAAPFTTGNLAVLRAESSSVNNTTCSVIELNPNTAAQSPSNVIAIDGTTLPNALRFSGSASSNGYLSNSADRSLLTFTGHKSDDTVANANSLTARAVATFGASGGFSIATTYTGTSGNQTRSATTLDNTTWFIADQVGIYTNSSATPSPAANVRSIKTFGGIVYTLQSSAGIAVSTVSAATGGSIAGLPGLGTDSTAQDFYLISSGINGSTFDVLYLLTTAGIKKYSLVSGSWTANGSYATVTGFGLAAEKSGGGAALYLSTGSGSTAANNVVKVADTAGHNSSISVTTSNNVVLYTAPAGTTVKGVAFAPVNPLLDLVIGVTAPANATTGTTFDYTLTASNSGSTSASGITAQFTLPAGLTFVSASGTSGFTGIESSGVVTFSGGTLNGSTNATLTVTVTAASPATYSAPVAAAVIDPGNTVSESNEANNSSPAATSTMVVVPNSPSSFNLQPTASQSVNYGATTILTVAASGSPTPTFQWYLGASGDLSNPLSGETGASFTTPPVTANTSYWVRASNGNGIADSNTASISVVLSADSSLTNLTLGSGTLSPAFASGTFIYNTLVSSSTTGLTVAPTVGNAFASAQVRVNGGSYTSVASGSPSGTLALNTGANTVDVLVTAQNGSTSTYTVTVTRSVPSVLVAGDLLFTAINADEDGLAVAALRDIPANSTVYFTDNEWDGSAFNAGESYSQWVSGATLIPAGTVIRFSAVDTATPGASVGTFSRATVSGNTNWGISTGEDSVYAYVADSVTSAPTFIAAICTTSFGTTTAGVLTNTGLSLGNGAIQTGFSGGSDFAEYTGSRSNQMSFAAYLPVVSNISNWFKDTANGDYATTIPDTTAFTLGGTVTSTLAVNDISITEGNSGTTNLTFTVTRTDDATAFSVDYATADGTAVQPGDYTAASGTLAFTAGGALTQSVSVTIQGDTTLEADETFFINLTNVVNSVGTTTISDAQGIGGILNDEPVFTTPLSSASRNVLLPNTNTWPAAGVTVNGTQFVNLGLQGVGRLPASAIDPATGESLGSISDMQVTDFVKNQNGTFSGTFHFLPDRGYNSGAIFSNYAARINTFGFTFTPQTTSAVTTTQDQIAMTFTGSTRFTYDHDANPVTPPVYTTGLLSNKVGSLFGTSVPVVNGTTTQSDGAVTDRLTLDTEGLVLDKRSGKTGTGWVSDEYGPYIYHFNAAKQIDGQLQLPAALVPRISNAIDFAGTPQTGRRDNQGMEGLTQSPDGTKLFALMQSATIQDSGSGNIGRSNTRLLVYDVSGSDIPSDPIAQYVIQLPLIDSTGSTTNGSTVDRNGAQSSILALNDHQILVLSREGNGRGASGSPVFKSILLADLSSATNIDGSFDTATGAVAPGGVLNASVTPLSWTEALNMLGKLDLNITELAQFGINLNAAPGDINSLCEKWEALALVPANDPSAPNDHFLFIGNDNDFQTATGKYMGAAGNLQNYNAGLENDTVVLAYRVRIVEPLSPVNAWRQANFGTTSTAGNLANDADFDNDGIQNLAEYALGTNPANGSGADGPSALPFPVRNDADPLLTDRLALAFSIQSPNPADVTYRVQASDDLATWSDVASKSGTGAWTWLGGGTSRIVTSGSGPVSVKIGDSVPADNSNPKRMMRLKVSNP